MLRESPKRAGAKTRPRFRPAAARDLAATRRRTAPAGSTRSSSTATACRRGSTAARSDCSPARALDWTDKFKPVASAVAKLDAETALIDGEVVVEDENGVANFSSLQDALKNGKTNFVYYVFDLLYLDGSRSHERAAGRAQGRARAAAQGDRPQRHRAAERALCEISGAEMLEPRAASSSSRASISKRRNAPYRSGRSENWIKTKCQQNQEFVVVGYKESTHLKGAIGALVLGYYENGELQVCRPLRHRLHGRDRARSVEEAAAAAHRQAGLRQDSRGGARPQGHLGRARSSSPKSTFAGFTAQNHVRHAAFKGLREDKPAREVVRESADAEPRRRNKAGEVRNEEATEPAKAAARRRRPKSAKAADRARCNLPTRTASIGPTPKITKQQLADYYASVWDLMAPHLVNRPLALVRCPGRHRAGNASSRSTRRRGSSANTSSA